MVINKLQSKSITKPKNNIIIDTYKKFVCSANVKERIIKKPLMLIWA
jgi:hypothetical protein